VVEVMDVLVAVTELVVQNLDGVAAGEPREED
jgi:hypothetical protein